MSTCVCVVVAAIAANGCRKPPYQADATMLGGGAYMIRAQVKAGEGEGLADQYAYRRANEVCPVGYLLDERKANAVPQTEHVFVVGRHTVYAPEVVLKIRCSDLIADAGVAPDAPLPSDAEH